LGPSAVQHKKGNQELQDNLEDLVLVDPLDLSAQWEILELAVTLGDQVVKAYKELLVIRELLASQVLQDLLVLKDP